MIAALAKVSRRNINLGEDDKEWLKWHLRLGHRGFDRIKFLMGLGTLAKSARMRFLHTKISKKTEPPKCAACCYAKAKRRPIPKQRKATTIVRDAPSSLKTNTLYPGQEISVDHMVSSVPGRTYEGYGKGHPSKM